MGHQKLYLYPVWVRLWHVVNALLCIALLITGASMYYGSQIINFATSVQIHNICGIILSLNYLMFFFGNLFTDNGTHYVIVFKGLFGRMMKQFMYYSFGIFKGEEPPFPVTKENKFNPLQQIAYYAIMYSILPLLVLTGIAMLFPENIYFQFFNIKGMIILDFIHVLASFIIMIFLIIHLYFSTMGEKVYTHFKSIINGWH